LSETQLLRTLRSLTEPLSDGFEHAFTRHALSHQIWPPDDDPWTIFILLGGRGAGKTRMGAEWIRSLERDRPGPQRFALVSETYADGREVMIDGQSGLLHLGPPARRPRYEASRRRLVWPSGAVAYCFSSEDPDGLRGHEFSAAWSDELCKWKHAEETWSNLQLALRLGDQPRQMVTTTPRPTRLLKRLMKTPGAVISRATTYANAENLPRAFLAEIAAAFEGSALGRQELLGEIVEDRAGALWSWDMIEAARISVPAGFHASLDRIVVAVDPPATSGEGADECGVIVAGLLHGAETTAFVLADRSAGGLKPLEWAARAVAAYREFAADRIIVETNQGGEMAREIIRQIDPSVPVREARATRGKTQRAEPVAALYEQGRVRHAGAFPKLEDQMTQFAGLKGEKSPDRLDALVWALTDLMLRRPQAPGVKRV
jgi:phage terminase large subunit-like protein